MKADTLRGNGACQRLLKITHATFPLYPGLLALLIFVTVVEFIQNIRCHVILVVAVKERPFIENKVIPFLFTVIVHDRVNVLENFANGLVSFLAQLFACLLVKILQDLDFFVNGHLFFFLVFVREKGQFVFQPAYFLNHGIALGLFLLSFLGQNLVILFGFLIGVKSLFHIHKRKFFGISRASPSIVQKKRC